MLKYACIPGMKAAKSPAPTPVRVAITPTLMAVFEAEVEKVPAVVAVVPEPLLEQEARTAPTIITAAMVMPNVGRRALRTALAAPVAGSFNVIPLASGADMAPPGLRVTLSVRAVCSDPSAVQEGIGSLPVLHGAWGHWGSGISGTA